MEECLGKPSFQKSKSGAQRAQQGPNHTRKTQYREQIYTTEYRDSMYCSSFPFVTRKNAECKSRHIIQALAGSLEGLFVEMFSA